MLSPRYLKQVTYDIEELFELIETDILCDIARRIKDNEFDITSTASHQLNRLRALDLQYEDVQKRLSKLLNISESRVAEIIKESAYGSVDADNEIFKKAYEDGFIPKFDYKKESLKDTILKGIKATNGELRNICKSMASASNKVYGDALDMAYLSIKSGAFSQAEAIKNAVKKVAKDGVTWIEYGSGAHRRPDSAIRNAVRTGINQTACRCQDKNFEDMGGNLVEVSSHMGARPTHAEWQGKIYWRKTQYKNYSNFETATGYGSVSGLGGAGCRHSFFPFFEGISSKTFEHYRLGENEDQYILEQTQRYNERQIREWKRRMEVNKAGEADYSKEQSKVEEWQNKQKDLLKANPDMKRNYARENNYVVDKKEYAKKHNATLSKGYATAIKKGDISSFITPEIYAQEAAKLDKQLVGLKAKDGIIISGYKTHFLDRHIGEYESSNENIKGMRKGVSIDDIIECLQKPTSIRKKSDTDWNYISDSCKVTLNPKTKILIQVNPYKKKRG